MKPSLRFAATGLLLTLRAFAQSPAPDLRGIFIYTNDVSQISNATASLLTQSFTIPGVDGVAVVTNNGTVSAYVTAQAQALPPSFFVFGGGPYAAAEHLNGSYVGPSTLYPPYTSPAKAGEYVALFANGFGPTSVPVVIGSSTQLGILTTLPVVKIGGIAATVQFVGLVAPGEFQFNVVVPSGLPSGDQPLVATYGGATTQPGVTITIQ